MKKAVATPDAPQAIGPYSQAIVAERLVFVSGQIPLSPEGQPAAGGIKEQTKRCLRNIEAVLKAAGLGMPDVVKTTVFMTDLGQFPAMNEAYAKYFAAPFPARATVEVSKLPKDVLIEIEAVAAISR